MCWRLAIAINPANIVKSVQLGRESTVDTKELLVHDGCKGKVAEGIHDGVVNAIGVLVFAFELEGEVVGQVATLVIAAEEEERIRVPNFERPEVQHALNTEIASIYVVPKEKVSVSAGLPPTSKSFIRS